MKFNVIIKKWLCYAGIVLCIGCQTGNDNVRTIKVGHSHSKNHSFNRALEIFAEELAESSDGRYEVKIFHSAQIGSEKEMQEMLTIGSLEMCATGLLNNYEPLFAIFEMPYLYRDREHIFKVNNGPIMEDMSRSLHKYGLRILGFYENGFRNITNSVRPVHSPEDVQNLMIRTPENPAYIATFDALGAIPTPLSFSELYSALIQGVVDGQENPLQNIWLGKLFEAQEHVAMTHHIYNSAYLLISERFWNNIPKQDQSLLRQAIEKSIKWQLDYMKNLDQDLIEKVEEKGMEVTYPDREAFKEATKPAYDVMYDRLGSDAKELVERIRETK